MTRLFAYFLVIYNNENLTNAIRIAKGKWLWLSGRFRYLRSAVRIQSSARFYNEHVYCWKGENKEKEARNGPIYKNCQIWLKILPNT